MSDTIQNQVQVNRRIRLRRMPCGHCGHRLPRFMSLAPVIVVCPHCAGKTQVGEAVFFRRGWAVA